MADSLETIGSIAIFLNETFDNVSDGVSGNMVIIADMARQHVANYVGESIGSNSINIKFQPAIVDFAKADTIDFANAQGGGEMIKLAELSIDNKGDVLSAKQYRMMGESKLQALGRKTRFSRSLS